MGAPAPRLKYVDAGLVPYAAAYRWQQRLHAARVAGTSDDVLLLLEHPHVYTFGRRFRPRHLLVEPAHLLKSGAELHEADRGGSVTYHGPGQLVAYPIVDLRPVDGGLPDPIGYLRLLERAIVDVLEKLGVAATTRPGLTGVWVGEEKIASIGVNVSRGVAKHGVALNVSPDLAYYSPIVPCGIEGCVVTSIERRLGYPAEMARVKSLVVEALGRGLKRRAERASLLDLGLLLEGEPSEAGRLPERVEVGA